MAALLSNKVMTDLPRATEVNAEPNISKAARSVCITATEKGANR